MQHAAFGALGGTAARSGIELAEGRAMSQVYSSTTRSAQAAANTAAIAAAISARADRVRADLQHLSQLERSRPLSREEQDRADWLRWLSNRLAIELTTLRQELATVTSDPPTRHTAAA